MVSSVASMSPQLLHSVLQFSPGARRWWIAYSGGMDSHVLLHLCHQFLAELPAGIKKPELCAVHVNHQLQAQSGDWAEHCRIQAEGFDVKFVTASVLVDNLPRKSLEAQAREARYEVFERCLDTGDVLLMGHHSDDQAETLLMRLLRGSGSKGLGAMPVSRALAGGSIYRPLLNNTRLQIEHYAQSHGLSWVDDPSNQQHDFDRNFIRHKLLPILGERWPNYAQTLSRSAALSREASQLIQELAALDIERLGLSSCRGQLLFEPLKQLGLARQRNILRYWLQELDLELPSEAQLTVLVSEVIHAKEGASPELNWANVSVHRSGLCLYAAKSLPSIDVSRVYTWDGEAELALAGAGVISSARQLGRGLAVKEASQLTIRFRQGGECLRPVGRGGSRKLKKLLQELKVPYWLRDRVPLIYIGDELIAVADIVIDERWQVGHDVSGVVINWQRP